MRALGKVSWGKTAVFLEFVQITSPPPLIWTTCTTFSNVEIQELKVSLGLHKDAIYIT